MKSKAVTASKAMSVSANPPKGDGAVTETESDDDELLLPQLSTQESTGKCKDVFPTAGLTCTSQNVRQRPSCLGQVRKMVLLAKQGWLGKVVGAS